MAHNSVLDDLTPVRRPTNASIGNTFTPGVEDDEVFPETVETSPCPVKWDVFESHEFGLKPFDGSSLQFLKLFLKLCFAFLLCLLVLLLGLLNKFTLLKSYAQMNTSIYNNSCSSLSGSLTESTPNEVTDVTNLWALLLCLCLPYFQALVPLIRRILFKNTRAIKSPTLHKVLILETLHSIGLFMLTYLVLPKLGIVHAILVLEGIGLFPIILKVTEHKYQKLSILSRLSDWFVLLCQISFSLYWLVLRPVIDAHWESLNVILPVSVLLISFHWWDNYAGLRPGSRLCRTLLKLKKSLQRTRTRTYLVINLWKVCVNLVLFVFVIGNWRLDCYRALFYMQTSAGACLAGQMGLTVSGENLEPLINALVNVSATFLCYQCVKIACRVLCQIPCFVLPLSLLPFLSIMLIPAINLEEFQWTNISDSFQWRITTSWKEYMLCAVLQEHLPIGILWIISVLLLAGQIFNTGTERLASIEKLFVKPMYCDILLEKFWFLNRRRDDFQYKSTEKRLRSYSKRSCPSLESHSVSNMPFGGEKRPMVFICATVWHETEKEMCEMLKSIFRVDIDQSARRHAREYFHVKDTDYYAFEAHIIVDDAFDSDGNVNGFVKQLVRVMDSAVSCVHNVILHMKPPTKYTTPYGGRLEWTLPGGNLMMVHLKNKKMIRTKKRWSQVMYMYWILGYRLMSIDGPSQLKHTIAENTYLLTLDGDVEFKPAALLKLLDRMKKNVTVGAACGRIHPVGSGPLVWYQKFEYAISHWLQKSSEHVIGCVLCSPGCFSLFRGSALMDDNVLSTYTGVSSKSIDYLQRDQGEDRWLCTLLLRRGYRVEYCAASDAMTFAPEKFNEFFNQRRRWIPSTMANTLEILSNWKIFIHNNDNISFLYLAYQAILMVISFVSPGTIFLLIVGAISKVYPSINLSTSFLFNFLPMLIMMIMCKYASTEKQLNYACILSMTYIVVMMTVLAGLCFDIAQSLCSSTSVFAILVFGAFGLAALLHPQEFPAIFGIFPYLLAVPCMSVILIIYAMGNLHIVSWGTREIVQQPPELIPKEEEPAEDQNQTATAPTFGVSFLGKSPQRNTVLEHIRRMVEGLRKAIHKEKCSDGHDQILQRIQEMDYKVSKVLRQQRNDRMSLSSVPCTPIFLRFNHNEVPRQQEQVKRVEPVAWYNDKGLGDGRLSEISTHEGKFWNDFIRKYLLPLQSKPDDQMQIKASLEKLRNRIAIVYVLSNMCFITLIISLEYSNVSNQQLGSGISCYMSGIRPLSIVFAMVFGMLLVCQLVAMLLHRISTFLHIISSIDLRFPLPFDRAVQLNNLQLAKDMQSLDKDVVDPESVFVYSTDDDDDEGGDDDVFQAGRTGNCRNILNRKRQPVWVDKADRRCREPGSLRGRFHENFKNITGRRYNKSESEQLVREREMAGFHVNSLPALAVMVNNSELIRQRWERATQRIIAQYRTRKMQGLQSQPKLVGVVNSYYASPALLELRDRKQEPPETPIVIEPQEAQRSTRFVFIPNDTFDTPL